MRSMKTVPGATPIVDCTRSPSGRRREKAKPVPPPDWWMRAVSLIAWKIPSMLSGTGRTKQAESCWRPRPAFIRVGELGGEDGLLHGDPPESPGSRFPRGPAHLRAALPPEAARCEPVFGGGAAE